MREKLVLHCNEANHDKVYILWMEDKGDGNFTVEARWGRRGGSSQTQTKTDGPVPEGRALACFDKIAKEKRAKGYVEDPDVDPFNLKRDAARSFIAKFRKYVSERSPVPIEVDPQAVISASESGGSGAVINALSGNGSSRFRVLAKDFYDADREAFAVLALEVTSG